MAMLVVNQLQSYRFSISKAQEFRQFPWFLVLELGFLSLPPLIVVLVLLL